MDARYTPLQKAVKEAEGILEAYKERNRRRMTRRSYERMVEGPKFPHDLEMTDREIELKTNYVYDHMPLLNDIRNDKEYEALCRIFREFRFSLSMKTKTYKETRERKGRCDEDGKARGEYSYGR